MLSDEASEVGQEGGAPGASVSGRGKSMDVPSDASLKRAPLVDDEGGAELIVQSPTAVATAVIFTGLAYRTGMPLPVFDRYLAALDVNAIYLRDFSRLLYNGGVPSIASDFDGTIQYLRQRLTDLGNKPLATIGISAGGYGAIRYGLALEARTIISFSGLTNLTTEFMGRDGRGRHLVARGHKVIPPDAHDTHPMVRRAQGRTDIHLIYGDAMPQDTMHALHLRDEPGVTLHPLEKVKSHNTPLVLARRQKMMSTLSDLILERASLSEPVP